MEIINVMGFNVFSGNLEDITLEKGKASILSTISPNSYGISTKDSLFKKALKEADILVLDGVYFALASILLLRKNIKKNQGPDVFRFYMNRLNIISGRVFFLGSNEETLSKIVANAKQEYPNISIKTFSPSFSQELSIEENAIIHESINCFRPDVLFVGMTCPKQEKWAYQNKNKINVELICSIGAVFDWYAGNQKDIHPLWWKLRLAWLKRTIDRPEILLRYPNIGIFFKDLFLSLIGIKK
jgi:N-acetylglucosaminyldiphosphoundecaprenol N-acetyl-beta-D-mannosaminyltransferase